MQLRLFVLFLLGLFLGNILIGNWAQAASSARARPYFRADTVYLLAEGTSGCPSELLWKNHPSCEGFQLIHTKKSLESKDSQRFVFCSVNKGKTTRTYQVSSWESFRIQTFITWKDNVIHKSQNSEQKINQAVISTKIEESLILDPNAFVFDRSVAGKGWSCLYKKN